MRKCDASEEKDAPPLGSGRAGEEDMTSIYPLRS